MGKSPAALTSTTFQASSKVSLPVCMHMHTELHILEYANSATTKHKLQAEGRKNKASTEMYRKVEEDWEAGRTHEGRARVLGGEDDLLLS